MSEPRSLPSPAGLVLGLLACAALGCQGSGKAVDQPVADAVQHGRYGMALERARRQAEANPGDSNAQAVYRDARVAYILDQGRREVFKGQLTEGLAHFEEAKALAPDHPTVESWIEKTRAQLAVYWLDRAAEQIGPEHMNEAELCYEKVLHYDPDNPDAVRGLSQLLLLKNYRGGMSKTYFDDGLSSFHLLQLEQARRAFQVSRRYAENEPAASRGRQVEKMIAEDRLAQAKHLESAGLYFAARNEYRLVLLVDPANEEGRDGLDRMDREARARRELSAAEMHIRRGALETAEKTLAQAEILTEAQKDQVSLLQSGIEDKRLEDMYLAAQSLTDDYRYPEAVQAFAELLAIAPDYKDAALRKATVEEFISLAEDFYAKAAVATTDEEAEGFLRAIQIPWPEYKDVAERLRAIEARKAAKKDGGG